MGKHIGPGKTVSDSNKSYTKSLRNVILRSQQTKRFEGFLLSLDLERVFDRVNHEFFVDPAGTV